MTWSRALGAAALALALAGCSAAGVPLAGSYVAGEKCPVNGCAGLDPDATQIAISNAGKTQLYLPPEVDGSGAIVDHVELGGDCYASNYPGNRIEVTVWHNSNQVLLNSGDVISTRTSSNLYVPKCVNGRYGFAIRGAAMPGGNVYQVRVTLIGIDATGAEYPNPGGNTLAVSVSR